ncbi:PEP/pyruvate-binding domain-containing protein [Desulfotalea psychrophila]|uniref:Probable phosphoenolpyruvate synthase/pyruvate phosphate dikinase n=1 Tax=Desulfotalea psychrophila (strain LSv54 / DSM 12343) TaxID=177439 RepID=Q6AJB0_DESPS|nr:PEP/pyruvate-binding domain-containing protein [Desulfotalea psychrophila]CAG37570.1 probable phosphoenolpyruvate synthase/pyruvate phosphate dikinase [Desulfotalea psychrophila LSv54]
MGIDPSKMIPAFDPHFKVFHDLMPFKVQEILLVSSLYDAFILEEDGSLTTRLIEEYKGLNLSKPPKITRASSPEEAFELVAARRYDLVITMPYLQGMNGFELGCKIKEIRPLIPVVLVAHNVRATLPPDEEYSHGIDGAFLWCCEADLFLAIIKCVEDFFNVSADTKSAMVRVIIYVEDSPTYRSRFLPLIYQELVGQTQSVLDESLNERHRILRMRARPRILLAKSYEEALELFEKYQPYVFGVISDARFMKGGEVNSNAGGAFLSHVSIQAPDVSLLMVSSEERNRAVATDLGAVFINKNSPATAERVHNFFLRYLGFGDFVFQLENGDTVCRATTLGEFQNCLKVVPDESLCYHLLSNHFSNWVMARTEVVLARDLHRDCFQSMGDLGQIREELIARVFRLRRLRQRGVVVNFSRRNYDPNMLDFVKIGKGSMGGKARGMAFMWACLQGAKTDLLSSEKVTMPKTCVIAADGFDTFITENKLQFAKNMGDDKVVGLFLDAELPGWLKGDLRAFLKKWDLPLSVRSSSLLEDAQFKPYAGLFSTYFLPNNHSDFEERLSQLESAIKLVYASTWFEGPREFSKDSIQGRGDSMAVIIQQLVGHEHNGFWYPSVSGVAQSHNYYPIMNMAAADGVAHIALGLGKMVVEGGRSLLFSPAHPKKLVQFSSVEDILANSQRQFYALSMQENSCLRLEHSNLVLREIQEAEHESPVMVLASTYIADEHRIRDACLPGVKVMTFAHFLKYSNYPLAQTLQELLHIGKTAMGCEVEIEFVVTLSEDLSRSTFYLLQIRPMIAGGEYGEVSLCEDDYANAFCASSQVLGHGKIEGMVDILFVDPNLFDSSKTQQIASEVGKLARKISCRDCSFLLIGPGRWGTADPWLGIPVQWRDIAGVGAIVEVQNSSIRAEPSQGSHFFQNITSLGIPYITVNELGADKGRGKDYIDWQWLRQQNVVESGDYVRHVRLSQAFVVKCDGKKGEGVISVQNKGLCG